MSVAALQCSCLAFAGQAEDSKGEQRRLQNAEFARWRSNSAKVRGRMGLAAGATPWTWRAAVHVVGCTPSERQRDLLDVAWVARRSAFPDTALTREIRKSWWVNLSQSVQRHP